MADYGEWDLPELKLAHAMSMIQEAIDLLDELAVCNAADFGDICVAELWEIHADLCQSAERLSSVVNPDEARRDGTQC